MWRYSIMRGLLMVPELHRFICPAFTPVPFRFHWERAFIWDRHGLQEFCRSLHTSYVDVLVAGSKPEDDVVFSKLASDIRRIHRQFALPGGRHTVAQVLIDDTDTRIDRTLSE